eukprot:Rmarinus@m.1222
MPDTTGSTSNACPKGLRPDTSGRHTGDLRKKRRQTGQNCLSFLPRVVLESIVPEQKVAIRSSLALMLDRDDVGDRNLGSHTDMKPFCVDFKSVIMFVDISGFSTLAHQLVASEEKEEVQPIFPKTHRHSLETRGWIEETGFSTGYTAGFGAESLACLLNSYYEPMIKIIAEHGGDIYKIAGDALFVLFRYEEESKSHQPSDNDAPPEDHLLPNLKDACHVALDCAKDLIIKLRDFEVEVSKKVHRLGMHVAISHSPLTGLFVGGVGNTWEFVVMGEALKEIAVAESMAKSGEIALAQSVASILVKNNKTDRLGSVQFCSGTGIAVLRRFTCTPPEKLKTRSGSMNKEEVPLSVTREQLSVLRGFVPAPVRVRMDSDATWLAELRRVTTLFISLPPLDTAPAGLLQVTQKAIATTQVVLAKFEGMLRQMIMDDKGCVIIAVFGAPPFAHNNDPSRGVGAAMMIHSELKRSLLIDVSIGVTSGYTFVGIVGGTRRCEYAMVGDVVNMAARLMGKAAGGVLVDDHTRHLASDHRFEELDPVKVKGKENKVQIFRPITDCGRQSSSQDSRTALLGRTVEVSVFHDKLASLMKGQGGLLLVEGEGGYGKTRLLEELQDQSRSRSSVMTVFVEANYLERDTAYHTMRSIMLALLGPEVQRVLARNRDSQALRTSLVRESNSNISSLRGSIFGTPPTPQDIDPSLAATCPPSAFSGTLLETAAAFSPTAASRSSPSPDEPPSRSPPSVVAASECKASTTSRYLLSSRSSVRGYSTRSSILSNLPKSRPGSASDPNLISSSNLVNGFSRVGSETVSMHGSVSRIDANSPHAGCQTAEASTNNNVAPNGNELIPSPDKGSKIRHSDSNNSSHSCLHSNETCEKGSANDTEPLMQPSGGNSLPAPLLGLDSGACRTENAVTQSSSRQDCVGPADTVEPTPEIRGPDSTGAANGADVVNCEPMSDVADRTVRTDALPSPSCNTKREGAQDGVGVTSTDVDTNNPDGIANGDESGSQRSLNLLGCALPVEVLDRPSSLVGSGELLRMSPQTKFRLSKDISRNFNLAASLGSSFTSGRPLVETVAADETGHKGSTPQDTVGAGAGAIGIASAKGVEDGGDDGGTDGDKAGGVNGNGDPGADGDGDGSLRSPSLSIDRKFESPRLIVSHEPAQSEDVLSPDTKRRAMQDMERIRSPPVLAREMLCRSGSLLSSSGGLRRHTDAEALTYLSEKIERPRSESMAHLPMLTLRDERRRRSWLVATMKKIRRKTQESATAENALTMDKHVIRRLYKESKRLPVPSPVPPPREPHLVTYSSAGSSMSLLGPGAEASDAVPSPARPRRASLAALRVVAELASSSRPSSAEPCDRRLSAPEVDFASTVSAAAAAATVTASRTAGSAPTLRDSFAAGQMLPFSPGNRLQITDQQSRGAVSTRDVDNTKGSGSNSEGRELDRQDRSFSGSTVSIGALSNCSVGKSNVLPSPSGARKTSRPPLQESKLAPSLSRVDSSKRTTALFPSLSSTMDSISLRRHVRSFSSNYAFASKLCDSSDALRPMEVEEALFNSMLFRAASSELLSLAPLLNDIVPQLQLPDNATTKGLRGKGRADMTKSLFVRLMQRIPRPLVIFIDNCHWADSASISLIEAALSRATYRYSEGGVLLVLSTSPTTVSSEPGRTEHRLSRLLRMPYTRLPLKGLSRWEVTCLIADALNVLEVPDEIVSTVYERASGNPLFSIELVQHFADKGALAVENNIAVLRVQPDAISSMALPISVQAAFIQKIDSLPFTQQLILKVASVIGTQFQLGMCDCLIPYLGDDVDLKTEVDCLVSQGILEVVPGCGPYFSDEPVLAFKHVVMQNAIYNTLLRSQREELHLEFAQWYATEFHDHPEQVCSLLAYHYRVGGSPANAVVYYEMAALQAFDQYANEEVIANLNSSLELVKLNDETHPVNVPQLALWHRMLGDSYMSVGILLQAQNHYETCLRLMGQPVPSEEKTVVFEARRTHRKTVRKFAKLGIGRDSQSVLRMSEEEAANWVEACRAFLGLVDYHIFQDEKENALHAAYGALHLAKRAPKDTEWLVLCYVKLARLCGGMTQHPRASKYCAKAKSIYPMVAGETTRGAEVFYNLGLYELSLGVEWDRTRATLEQSIQQGKQIGDEKYVERAYYVLAIVYRLKGDWDMWRDITNQLVDSARHRGDMQALLYGLHSHSQYYLATDQLAECSSCLEEALEILKTMPDTIMTINVHATFAVLATYQADEVLALAEADIAYDALKAYGHRAEVNSWMTRDGRADVTAAYISTVAAARHHRSMPSNYGSHLSAQRLSVSSVEGGADLPSTEPFPGANTGALTMPNTVITMEGPAKECVRRAYVRAQKMCSRLIEAAKYDPSQEPRARLLKGSLAWVTGDPRKAAKNWRRALTAAESLKMPYAEALAKWELGLLSPNDGETLRKEATEIFRTVGATYHVNQAADMERGVMGYSTTSVTSSMSTSHASPTTSLSKHGRMGGHRRSLSTGSPPMAARRRWDSFSSDPAGREKRRSGKKRKLFGIF